jgi:hypothetical protein
MTDILSLLEKGYFPKELPPPFNTKSFTSRLAKISESWDALKQNLSKSKTKKYSTSSCVNFSYPKVGYSRRILSVPNPVHQYALSDAICSNWDAINAIYSASPFSSSRPKTDQQGFRAFTTERTYKEFRERAVLNSYAHLWQMRTDISRYYPTIYTHIIPWLIDGKQKAKKNRNDLSLLGNLLDLKVRNTQSGQTMGLPVGPDSSFIIAEIIACKIDERLAQGIKKIGGERYFDDYILYFKSSYEAEEALKRLQKILSDHHLELNEGKTYIENFPIVFGPSDPWTIDISTFRFRKSQVGQKNDLYAYFSLAFDLSQKSPKDTVLKYALGRIKNLEIHPENWNVFESLLLKTTLVEPSILPEVVRTLIKNKEFVNREKLREAAHTILDEHYFKGHSFEISWALWLLRSFAIPVDSNILQKVINASDPISSLIALDIYELGLTSDKLETDALEIELAEGSLFDEKWILVYEAIKKGWLLPSDKKLISSNEYFDVLNRLGIEFYDANRQVSITQREANKKDYKTASSMPEASQAESQEEKDDYEALDTGLDLFYRFYS